MNTLPHTDVIYQCYGYWLASSYSENNLWCVVYNKWLTAYSMGNTVYSIRPVVCLPSSITGTLGDEVEI